jgi:hypothetical protein
MREVANVRIHGELKQRPIDRFEVERAHLEPYAGTVVNLNALSRTVPTPIESLQHPLSSYDALVVSQ